MTSPAQTTSTLASSTGSGSPEPTAVRRVPAPARARAAAPRRNVDGHRPRAGIAQRRAELPCAAAEVQDGRAGGHVREQERPAQRRSARAPRRRARPPRPRRAGRQWSGPPWVASLAASAACEDRPVRILAVCAVAHPGGAEIGLLRLAPRLTARGHDLTLATPGPGPLDDAGLPMVRLDVGGLERGAGARAVRSWPRVRRLARDADLVYLNGTVCGRLLPALRGRGAPSCTSTTSSTASRASGRSPTPCSPTRRPSPTASPAWTPTSSTARSSSTSPHVARAVAAGRRPRAPSSASSGASSRARAPLDLVARGARDPRRRAGRPDRRSSATTPTTAIPDYVARRCAPPRASSTCPGSPTAPPSCATSTSSSRRRARSRSAPCSPRRWRPARRSSRRASAALPEVVADGVTGLLVTPGRPDELAAAVLEVLGRRAEMGAAARAARAAVRRRRLRRSRRGDPPAGRPGR